MTSPFSADWPPEVCAHLSEAIRHYRKHADTQGFAVPLQLRQVEHQMAARVIEVQLGAKVEQPGRRLNDRVVEPNLVTYTECADFLSCSLSTVKRRVATGQLTPVRHGGVVRIRLEDLRTFIKMNYGA